MTMLKKTILIIAALILMPSFLQAENHYLMSYFVGNGEDGLHLLHSTDGLKWESLGEGKSFLKPVLGKDKLMRDPSIVRGPDGTFHMVWTISWTQPGIGYASSKNLIDWSEQKLIPVMEDDPKVRNCWAPELFYDEKTDEYLIIWASTVPGKFEGVGSEDNYNHRQYYVTTKDFKTFSKTKIYYDPGHNVIDAFLAKDENRYMLFYKDETLKPEPKKSIHLAVGDSPLGPFEPQGEIGHINWIEGPAALKIDDYWYVYYDCYRNRHYGAVRSKDLKNWENITENLSFPKGVRHGTFFEADTDTVRLLKGGGKDEKSGKIAAKPLFRDPIYDGAADPVVIWNKTEKKWFMFYTNRRANVEGLKGVSWVHGTPIGIAESDDGGATWKYRCDAKINYGEGEFSYWAPEVIEHEGTYHMYLTFVPGMHTDWSGTRDILHLTSKNLVDWKYESTLKLSSNRVIDACVFRLDDGTWRMWYNNERDRKSIYYADSPDLFQWTDKGKAVGDYRGEGAKVVRWEGKYWMFVDNWQGLGVYHSQDAETWTKQPGFLLDEPGKGEDDGVMGGHADVIVNKDRAYIFYFTHPGRRGDWKKIDNHETRRSSIQVVELEYKDGVVSCDRNKPCHIHLSVD